MKVLVIGASGFVGGYLLRHYSAKHEVYGTYFDAKNKPFLDITSRKDVAAMIKQIEPDVIFLAAAYTDVNGCEANPEKSYDVNFLGAKNVAEASKKAKLIFFSTDYIFDGKHGPYSETDKPNPLNVYGRHKVEAEKWIQTHVSDALIIHATWFFGYDPNSKNFSMSLIKNLRARKHMQVPNDQYAYPTYVENLLTGVELLVEAWESGIYNIAGSTYCSRYKFATSIADMFDLDKSLITPVATSELRNLASRPLLGGFKTDKIINKFDFTPISVHDGLLKMKERMAL